MKTSTIQDMGMANEVNLCDSCCNEQPECQPDSLIFGSGIGDDNIIACNIYEAIELRHPKHKGAGRI